MADQMTLGDFDGQESVDDVDLSELSPMQRKCYVACDLGDLGPRDFARREGLSFGTVGNHLARARAKLADDERPA